MRARRRDRRARTGARRHALVRSPARRVGGDWVVARTSHVSRRARPREVPERAPLLRKARGVFRVDARTTRAIDRAFFDGVVTPVLDLVTRESLRGLTVGELVDNLAAEHARHKFADRNAETSREFRRALVDEINARWERRS